MGEVMNGGDVVRIPHPTTYVQFVTLLLWFMNLELSQLYAAQTGRIAAFRRCITSTVVGPSHGLLQYKFSHQQLLVESLVSLCINRWMDMYLDSSP